MQGVFKKSISWLLSILLVAFLVPITAPAESWATEEDMQDELPPNEEMVSDTETPTEGEPSTEDLGTDTSWHQAGTARWKIEDGTLTIAPLEGQTVGVLDKQTNGGPWFDRKDEIRSAVIVEMIKDAGVGNNLFSGLTSLERVDLSGLDTSAFTSMASTFSGCSSLKSVDLSTLDLSSVKSMASFFRGCTSLESVDLSGLDMPNVTDMQEFFIYCSSLKNVSLTGLDISNVTNMYHFFGDCSALESIDLSGLKISKLSNMSGFFYNCLSLKSVNFGDIDVSSVTTMGQLFCFCGSLEHIDFGDFDTSSVRDMEEMFLDCRNLKALDLSSFTTTQFTTEQTNNSSRIFKGCAVTTITVSESFTLQKWFRKNLWYNADSERFLPAEIPVGVADTYTMGLQPQSVSIQALDVNFVDVGAELKLEAEALPQPIGSVVTWESSDVNIGAVDASTGVFTAISPGTVVITANAKFEGVYSSQTKSDTITIEVRKCVRSVTMKESSKVVYVNAGPFTLQADVDPPDAYNAALGWQSSNTAVATVDAAGQVTPLAVGETIITATAGGFSDTCTVVVENTPIVNVSSVTLNPTSLSLTGQEEQRITATVLPADATNKDVEWTSSDSAVATVDETGMVTSLGKGTATITASSLDGGIKATCAVTVVNPVTTAAFDNSPNEVRVSKSVNAAVKLSGALAGEVDALDSVAWTSSDSSVASVAGTGTAATVTGNGLGSATITFKGTVGAREVTASFDIQVVRDDVASITLSDTEKVLMVGSEPYELKWTIQPISAAGAPLVWKTSDASVASVDQSGIVTALKAGEATITVTTKGASAQCLIKVIERPADIVEVASLTLDHAELTLTGVQTAQLTATILPENATYKTIHWSSSDPLVARVDAAGKVTTAKKGITTITATSEDGKQKATCLVTVLNPVTSFAVTPAEKSVAVGETFNMGLRASGALPGEVDAYGAVTWSVSDGDILDMEPSGDIARFTAKAPGVAEVTVQGHSGSEDVRGTASVNVTWPAPDSFSINRHEAQLMVGSDMIQLTASASPQEALNAGVSWTSTDPNIITVDADGIVRPVHAGSATVKATLGNAADTCYVTVQPMQISASSDSEVPGYVLVNDSSIADALKDVQVVIKKSPKKTDARLRTVLMRHKNVDSTASVAEAYDIYLVDAAGGKVAWSYPEAPLTVGIKMDETLTEAAKQNALGIHFVDDEFVTVETKPTQQREGFLVFETTHFSTYALTATPFPVDDGEQNGVNVSGQPNGSGSKTGSTNLPQTGDSSLQLLYGLLALAFAAVVGCRAFAMRKDR